MARPPRRRAGGSAARLALYALAAVLALAGILAASVFAGPPARTGQETVVFVPRGAGLAAIAEGLAQAGVVSSPLAFKAAAVLTGRTDALKAGEYAIPSRASAFHVLAILVEGKSILHKVTIPEGWTSAMAIRRLAEADFLDGPVPPVPAEGSLLPATYSVLRGTTRAEVAAMMAAEHARVMAELWPQRARDLPFATMAEAVTLASIVEKETSKQEERPRVAAVFVNRLRQGMKLQSDPTIIYGVTRGEPLGRRIRQSEITMAHPWNTYVIAGLPPSPIANPGREALAAVLNPPRTDELFFVADGTGGHAFARTYAEHDANVRRWRDIQRARGLRDD